MLEKYESKKLNAEESKRIDSQLTKEDWVSAFKNAGMTEQHAWDLIQDREIIPSGEKPHGFLEPIWSNLRVLGVLTDIYKLGGEDRAELYLHRKYQE